ncbi:MAG: hypothetical protein ACFCUS_14470 [Rubrimonas sp.]
MTRILVRDLRTARYCLAGARFWFRRHGIAWGQLLEEGVEAERLRATGDALVAPVIAAAEARERAEQSQQADQSEAPHGR